jgi:hypothetical protein
LTLSGSTTGAGLPTGLAVPVESGALANESVADPSPPPFVDAASITG